MANRPAVTHSEHVHNGQSTQTAQGTRCCGGQPHVVALTETDPARSRVELVRCSDCGTSRWLLDGLEVDKQVALDALSATFAPAQPGRRSARVRQPAAPRPAATTPAAEPAPQVRTDAEIRKLLAGWQVLGESS